MAMFWPLHSNSIKNLSRSVWEENREKNKAQTSSRAEAGLGGEFEILLGFADGQTQTGNDRRPPAAPARSRAACDRSLLHSPAWDCSLSRSKYQMRRRKVMTRMVIMMITRRKALKRRMVLQLLEHYASIRVDYFQPTQRPGCTMLTQYIECLM